MGSSVTNLKSGRTTGGPIDNAPQARAALEGAGKVSEVFQRAIEGIRSRYFIQYAAPPAEAGSFRHIRVELTPAAKRRHADAILKAREGYYATVQQ